MPDNKPTRYLLDYGAKMSLVVFDNDRFEGSTAVLRLRNSCWISNMPFSFKLSTQDAVLDRLLVYSPDQFNLIYSIGSEESNYTS